jgi:hypothetical protein
VPGAGLRRRKACRLKRNFPVAGTACYAFGGSHGPTTSEEIAMHNEKKPEWQTIRDQARSKEAQKTKALKAARMAAEAAAAASAPPPAKKPARKHEPAVAG